MPQPPLGTQVTAAFADTIVASFAGHSHTSWFTVLRDAARNESVDVTYISGSGTPGGGNPTFRVFHYDTETYELRDYDQYWASLTAANAAGAASWVKDHSARAYYSLADLSAPEWERLASSWLTGDDQMQTWQVQCMWMRRLMAPPTFLLSWILGFLDSCYSRLSVCAELRARDQPRCAAGVVAEPQGAGVHVPLSAGRALPSVHERSCRSVYDGSFPFTPAEGAGARAREQCNQHALILYGVDLDFAVTPRLHAPPAAARPRCPVALSRGLGSDTDENAQ